MHVWGYQSYIYIYIYMRLRGLDQPGHRFVSFVRARQLYVRSEWISNSVLPSSFFPCEIRCSLSLETNKIKGIQVRSSASKWFQVRLSESNWIRMKSNESKWDKVCFPPSAQSSYPTLVGVICVYVYIYIYIYWHLLHIYIHIFIYANVWPRVAVAARSMMLYAPLHRCIYKYIWICNCMGRSRARPWPHITYRP